MPRSWPLVILQGYPGKRHPVDGSDRGFVAACVRSPNAFRSESDGISVGPDQATLVSRGQPPGGGTHVCPGTGAADFVEDSTGPSQDRHRVAALGVLADAVFDQTPSGLVQLASATCPSDSGHRAYKDPTSEQPDGCPDGIGPSRTADGVSG
jgi:hypothetical protein